MNVICLVIDRLHAGYVGAYGNTWVETPSFDRLAAESFVFDQFLIDTPELARLYRSYWQGCHAIRGAGIADAGRTPLPALVREAGLAPTLLTDEPTVAHHELSRQFDALIEIDPPYAGELAASVDRTHLAEFFARMVGWLEAAEGPFCLWCHAQGLGGAWDAPLDYRARYSDMDDPDPSDSAAVPSRILEDGYDPDELLLISQAYAGQVSLLDTCLGGLMEFLRAGPLGRDTLLVLLSARGFPLGEHRLVGTREPTLNGELVHVPLMVRLPNGVGAAARSQVLAHPPDLWATLLDHVGNEEPRPPEAVSLLPTVAGDATLPRDRLAVRSPEGQTAVRTPAWYLCDGPHPELYGKPDDRWEVNNVADRYPELVDSLRAALGQAERSWNSQSDDELPPLDDLLMVGLD